MLKIILVNIPRSDAGKKGERVNAVPPLGLAYIASVLKSKFEVILVDAFASRMSASDVVEIGRREKPDAIGITILTPWVRDAEELTKLIRREIPDAVIIAGGPHPTSMWRELLENKIADICVIGEGETTIYEFCEALEAGQDIETINGIAFRESNGDITITQSRSLIDDLDLIPLPDWNLLPIEKYWEPHMTGRNYARIFASRGCPHSCVFCEQRNIHGRKIRKRSPENIVDEIEYLVKEKDVRDIDINDSEFTHTKKWVQSICEEILR